MSPQPLSAHSEVLIVGAGLAGAAAAAALGRRGFRRVRLLEREARDGSHASGRNAGMVRQMVSSSALTRLSIETAREFARRAREAPAFPFRAGGSWLIGDPARLAALEAVTPGLGRLVDASDVARACPSWRGAPAEGVLHTPDDGLVDPLPLLAHFLGEAERLGVERRRSEVRALVRAGDAIRGVETDHGRLGADLVILAAGAWSDGLAREAGARPLGLRRTRRHLARCRAEAPLLAPGAFVWDLERDLYLRPWGDDPRDFLATPGDDEPVPGEDALADFDSRREDLLDRLAGRLGRRPRIEEVWAGVRTFTPDGDFAIGFDPGLAGLFWATGLGGHGVSSSWAVGRLVADLIGGADHPLARALSPARFGGADRRDDQSSSASHSK
ncbi:MAG: FAD-dependent oxidoreductase [Planctomycetota bacterium]